MHNVETKPCAQRLTQDVLTIRENDFEECAAEAHIRFQPAYPGSHAGRIVLDLEGENVLERGEAHLQTVIVGEDLYALRAMLLAMPEEAFVEPAPAKRVERWTDGDVVRVYGAHKAERVWHRRNGQWHTTAEWPLLTPLADREITSIVDRASNMQAAGKENVGHGFRRADILRQQSGQG